MERIVDEHMSSLLEVLNIINTTQEPLPMTKENTFKSWLAFRVVEVLQMKGTATPSSKSDVKPRRIDGIHPALKSAFESAYPPKHPHHRDLITIDFGQFFSYGIGEESFAQLSSKIESKISEFVCADTFHTHLEAVALKSKPRPPDGTPLQSGREDLREESTRADGEADWLGNPALRSVFRAAQGFDVLKWMFEERQDILATFVHKIVVPMDAVQPQVFRFRGRRD